MTREELFRQAFTDNKQSVFRICSHFFHNQEERNDAYQESLIRLWENLPGFRGDAKLSTWIYRVVVNSCLSHLRDDKRRRQFLSNVDSLPAEEYLHMPEFTDQPVQEEKIIFFRRFLMELNSSDRTLVSLYLEELSTHEMSEVTGMSEANVRVRIHRIKERIKQKWEENYNGTG